MFDLGSFSEGVARGGGGGCWPAGGGGGGGETAIYLLQRESFNYDTGPL